jgi:hypothetical protein
MPFETTAIPGSSPGSMPITAHPRKSPFLRILIALFTVISGSDATTTLGKVIELASSLEVITTPISRPIASLGAIVTNLSPFSRSVLVISWKSAKSVVARAM